MNIAIFTSGMHLPGGIERVTSILANYWATERGYKVIIITNSAKPSIFPLNENVRHVSSHVKIKHRWFHSVPGLYYYFSLIPTYIKKCKQIIDEYNIDIIVSMMNGTEGNVIKEIAGGIPTIGINHITWDLREKQKKQNKISYFISLLHTYIPITARKGVLYKYNKIVVISKTDHVKLQKCNKNAVTYIPNPCSITVHSQITCENRSKRLVTVGRFEYLKGQDRLIPIWEQIHKTHPDWRLTYVGDGYTLEDIKKEIEEKKLSSSVDFITYSQHVDEILLNSSVFVFTSRNESFGMVIIEAMTCGLPVIAYNCENGPRDIIDNYHNGFLIDEENISDFVKKTNYLINNDDERIRMGKNAIESVKRYNLTNIMAQWDDLFDELLPCNHK